MKDLIKFKRSFLALMLCFALTVSTLSGCSSSNKSDSDSILGYLSEGEALFEAGDYSGAIGAYKDAVLMDDKNEKAYLGLAEAYLEQGDIENAQSTLDMALRRIGEDNLSLKYAKLEEKVKKANAAKPGTENTVSAVSDTAASAAGDTETKTGDITEAPSEAAAEGIAWSDEALEKAVRSLLGKAEGPVTRSDVAGIQSLDISGKGVKNIGDLKHLTSLSSLKASNNSITDISVLTGLEGLKELYLEGNPVENPEKVLDIKGLSTVSMPRIAKSLIYLLRTSGSFDKILIDGKPDFSRLDDSTENGKRQASIMMMNSDRFSLQGIDIYEHNYPVGTRDTSYKWDQTVFYALEGINSSSKYINKNLCRLVKKELVNAKTGNIIDYEIYIDPGSGVANKIVSIEYLSDGLEIMEFYFDTDARVSFVFHYYVDNYISTYATPSMPGERFLYNKDALVTWRAITSSSTDNYVIGSNEAERLKSSWASKTIKKYDSLDRGLQREFDKNEIDMLNAAYNTYNTVMNADGIARIQGYVYDPGSEPMDNAMVSIYSEDSDTLLYTGLTGSDGSYSFYVPSEKYRYKLIIGKDGYDDVEVYGIAVDTDEIGAYLDTVYLFAEGDATALISLILGDAFNRSRSGYGMELLKNAVVYFRKGVNNRRGEVYKQGTTDYNGKLEVSLREGVYTIEVVASGYETMYYTIRANTRESNYYEFYTAPTLADNEYAIVLTWGDTPRDLDSHLFTTRGNTTNHVWFGRMTDSNGNYLDVDDTSSYGPETVTIRQFKSTDYYKYCVVDYTNCSSGYFGSYNMSYSGAIVNVYSKDGLIGNFHVPTGIGGVIWEVFEIRNGRLTAIQRYYDNVTDKSWWHEDK